MQGITTLVLVSKNEQTHRKQILYSTKELESDEETTILTSSFADQKIKHPDYMYFNFQTHFYVSINFDGRKEWEHKCLALVAITPTPFVHQIQQIMLSLINIYVSQTTMINTELLDSFVPVMNGAFQPRYTSSIIATSLLNRLDIHLITLLKLFVLEYRVLIYASKEPAAVSSETVLFLLSLLPGVFFSLPQNEEFEQLQLPLSLNTERRPVYMHLTLDNFYQMGNNEGVIACVSTPVVLKKSSDYDVVIDLSTGKFIYRQKSIEKTIEITQTDKLFIYNMKEAMAKKNKGLAKGLEGSNEWIFSQCSNYLLSLLHGLARNRQMFSGKAIALTGELQEVFVDFGKNFVTEFIKTNIFREWQTKMIESESNTKSFERVHPAFSGDIGTNTSNFMKIGINQDLAVDINVAFHEMSSYVGEWRRKHNEKKNVKEMTQTNETMTEGENEETTQLEEMTEKERMKQEKIKEKKERKEREEEAKRVEKEKKEQLKKEQEEKEEMKEEIERMDVPQVTDDEQFVDQDQPIDYFFS